MRPREKHVNKSVLYEDLQAPVPYPEGGGRVATVGTTGERVSTAAAPEHPEIRELRETFLELLGQERERHDRQLREERERGEELQRQIAQASAQVGYWKGRHEEAEAKLLALLAPAETRQGGSPAPWWRRLTRDGAGVGIPAAPRRAREGGARPRRPAPP